MSPLRLNGSTSGYSEIDAPAIAGDQTFTLPGTGGTLDRLERAGNILQVVNYRTGAVATGTTTIPADDTIPQNTEGDEYLSLSITPSSSSNLLFIHCVVCISNSANNSLAIALFQDSTANALATTMDYRLATIQTTIPLSYYMAAGTTSSTTFKVRAGGSNAGTTTLNGWSGDRKYGGTMASSITITEIAA
jgi:hypothetical protein